MTENTTPTPPEPEHRYALTGAVTGIDRCECGAAWTDVHEANTIPTPTERNGGPMSPEQVDAELVEKAAEAAFLDRWPTKVTGYAWAVADATQRGMYRSQARAALAAVMPDIQAQAFEAAAVRVRANFAAHGEQCPWVGFLDDEAARLRAARLTDTTERTTT